MGKRQSVQTWVSRILLVITLVVLSAASWAQFQVHQRGGWTQVDWLLSLAAPLPPQIQSWLDVETSRNNTSPGQLFHVMAPRLNLDTTFASGPDILVKDDVRVASNIKPFVAAGALILVETGRLKLDVPIGPYLSPRVARILRQSGREIDKITLRQLLNHSSGIADYGSSRLFQGLAYIPTAFGMAWHWTPEDQIWFAARFTQQSPIGAHFDYSDTNYLLVSDMIAKATQSDNAGIALRKLLNWPKIGAEDSFWEFYEPTPRGTRRIRQFRGAIEDTNLDVSFDQYGGGGLVMSMDDLAHAHRAIVRGEVFSNPEAMIATMQEAGTASDTNGYGLGISRSVLDGEICWSHGGRWGTFALHCPRLDLTIARSWGQSNGGPDPSDPNGPIIGLIKLAKIKKP